MKISSLQRKWRCAPKVHRATLVEVHQHALLLTATELGGGTEEQIEGD